MEERIVKGIWIPIEIWEADDLTWNEKILFGEIDSYTSKEKECFFSNEWIATRLKVTKDSACRMVRNLIKGGYIEQTKFDGRHRYLRSCIGKNVDAESAKMSMQSRHLRQCALINNNTDTNTNTGYYSKEDLPSSASSKSTPSQFSKPSLSEVETYCRERGNAVDAEAFIAFYESNGWRVGRNPMKDWKAAVRTWERRDDRRPERQPESVYEHNLREMQKLGLA